MTTSGVRVVKGFGQEQRELGRLLRALTVLFGSLCLQCRNVVLGRGERAGHRNIFSDDARIL